MSPWLDSGRLELGGGHCWEHREAFCGTLGSGSVGEGFLCGSPWRVPMKRVHGFKTIVVMAKMDE